MRKPLLSSFLYKYMKMFYFIVKNPIFDQNLKPNQNVDIKWKYLLIYNVYGHVPYNNMDIYCVKYNWN